MLVALICGTAAYAMPGDMGNISGDMSSGSVDTSVDMGSGSVDMSVDMGSGAVEDRFFWGNDDHDEEGRLLSSLNGYLLCFIIPEP